MATGQRALAAWNVLLLPEDSPPPFYEKESGTQAVMSKSCERQEKKHTLDLSIGVFFRSHSYFFR